MDNLWIGSKPKTWSCTQLASCSSLQWVQWYLPWRNVSIFLPSAHVNLSITLSPDVNFTWSRSIVFSPETQQRPNGKSSCSPFPQRGEEIDTDASGFISPDEILEHTSNPAVWLGVGSFLKGFFWGGFCGEVSLFWEPKKRLGGFNTQKKIGKKSPGSWCHW